MPRHITFSGNGSKILQILTPSNETLENFTKLIFEKVYGVDYDIDGVFETLRILKKLHAREES